MATVVVANTKGGSGKTTAALILGGEILSAGGRVAFVEGDPNRPLSQWAMARDDCAFIDADRIAADAGPPTSVESARAAIDAAVGSKRCVVIATANDELLMDWLQAAKGWATFCICDPEGSPNEWMTIAVSQADLVLVPFSPTALDANQVSRTIRTIRNIYRMLGRNLPFRTVLTRANPIGTRDEKEIRKEIESGDVPMLQTTLLDRAAFRALFSQFALLSELDASKVNGLEKARSNANAFAAEVLETMKADRREAA